MPVLTGFEYFQFLNVDQTSIDPSHNCTSELIGLILCLKTMVASLISIEFMYDLSIKKYFALGASYPEARIMIIYLIGIFSLYFHSLHHKHTS